MGKESARTKSRGDACSSVLQARASPASGVAGAFNEKSAISSPRLLNLGRFSQAWSQREVAGGAYRGRPDPGGPTVVKRAPRLFQGLALLRPVIGAAFWEQDQ